MRADQANAKTDRNGKEIAYQIQISLANGGEEALKDFLEIFRARYKFFCMEILNVNFD